MADRQLKYFDDLTGLWTNFTPGDKIDSALIPAGGGSGTFSTANIDFGATPAVEASVTIADETVTLTSICNAWITEKATEDNTATDHRFAGIAVKLVCGAPVAGVGFTIYAYCTLGYLTGAITVNYSII